MSRRSKVGPTVETPDSAAIHVHDSLAKSERAEHRALKVARGVGHQLLVPAVLLVIWEIVSRSQVIPIHLFPPPSVVFGEAAPRILSSSLIYESLAASVGRVGVGWFLASILGVLLGLAAGYSQRVRWILNGPINAGRSMPPAALIPLVIMWFGTGGMSAVLLIVAVAVWPVTINTIVGVEQVPSQQRDIARTLGATKLQEFVTVVVPASLPAIATGSRIAMGLAWMAVVLSELVGVNSGLGHFLAVSRETGDIPAIMLALAVIGVVAVGLDQAFGRFIKTSLNYQIVV